MLPHRLSIRFPRDWFNVYEHSAYGSVVDSLGNCTPKCAACILLFSASSSCTNAISRRFDGKFSDIFSDAVRRRCILSRKDLRDNPVIGEEDVCGEDSRTIEVRAQHVTPQWSYIFHHGSFHPNIAATFDMSTDEPASAQEEAGISHQDASGSMMPPPGGTRSSGRVIKPTLKMRDSDDDDDAEENHASGLSKTPHLRTRIRPSLKSAEATSSMSRPARVKLSLKSGHAFRGKGDPSLSGVNKTVPYMQGYDRELDSSDEETGEGMAFEEQIILRMPEGHEATKRLGEWVRRREVGNDGREVELKFKGKCDAFV